MASTQNKRVKLDRLSGARIKPPIPEVPKIVLTDVSRAKDPDLAKSIDDFNEALVRFAKETKVVQDD